MSLWGFFSQGPEKGGQIGESQMNEDDTIRALLLL